LRQLTPIIDFCSDFISHIVLAIILLVRKK
jgi:hypothetical protein